MQVNCKALLRLLKKNLVNTFVCEAVVPKPSFTYKLCNVLLSKMNLGNNISSDQTNSIAPPSEVRGIKILKRDAFSKEIHVPYVLVTPEKVKEVAKSLKPYFLKMPNLQPIQNEGKEKKVLLHPQLVEEKPVELQKILNKLNLKSISKTIVNLSYDNWTSDQIFKAVLPLDSTGNVSSYSIIGHIIHLNLKPDLMDFKHLIGEVLLDKFSNIRTVVNKTQIIENEFRNINMELLSGEPNFEVLVKENNNQFAFDFSKVFWNPRLSNEHNEIVKKTNPGDLVYDVFAGVGPFAVPLAKKKCHVHANDLNPDSFKWLCHNSKLNKVTNYLHPYNLDGKEFIQTIIKNGLIDFWKTNKGDNQVHILMNLPASALEFLECFRGLFERENIEQIGNMPIVYCYFFQKKDENVSDILGKYFDAEIQKNLEITFVRNVAPNKTMMRVTYKISKEIFFYSCEPPAKKLKCEFETSDINLKC